MPAPCGAVPGGGSGPSCWPGSAPSLPGRSGHGGEPERILRRPGRGVRARQTTRRRARRRRCSRASRAGDRLPSKPATRSGSVNATGAAASRRSCRTRSSAPTTAARAQAPGLGAQVATTCSRAGSPRLARGRRGADPSGRQRLRRARARLARRAAGQHVVSVSDLGMPRASTTCWGPQADLADDVGTWILTALARAGVAASRELASPLPARWQRSWPARLLTRLARPAGLSAAATAPGLASYTAVLLSHTAGSGWNEVRDELPFVFTGSAAASGGGFGMLCAPVDENGPARAFAASGRPSGCSPRAPWSRWALSGGLPPRRGAPGSGAARRADRRRAGRHGPARRRSRAGAGLGLALLAGAHSAVPRVRGGRGVDEGPEVRRRPPKRERLEARATTTP